MKITLSQTASWNPALTNPYRTRYATLAGRYFQISAADLTAPWYVEEITADGEWIDGGFALIVSTLAEARAAIAAAAEEEA